MNVLEEIGDKLKKYEMGHNKAPNWIRMGVKQFHNLCELKPDVYTSQKLYGINITITIIEFIKVE